MKYSSTWKKTSLALCCAASLMLPVLATAQATSSSAHAHGVPNSAAAEASGHDMKAPMAKMHADMESMQMSGDVDHDFAMMMRAHHQGAIDMAKSELAHGKDAQMKRMAEKIIGAQTKEITTLDHWMSKRGGAMRKK